LVPWLSPSDSASNFQVSMLPTISTISAIVHCNLDKEKARSMRNRLQEINVHTDLDGTARLTVVCLVLIA
jgi:hypothetical protein